MGKRIKALRISGWVLLILAGYLYSDIARITMLSLRSEQPSLSWYLKGAYLWLPVILLLAALVMSFFRRMPLQMTALGIVVAAGGCYCAIPPLQLSTALWLSYRFIPRFPFKLLQDTFHINLLSYMKYVPLYPYMVLYLLGLLLLIVAAVLMLIQSRRERPTLSASRDGQA